MNGHQLQTIAESIGLSASELGPDLGTPGRTSVRPLGENHFVKVFCGRSGRKAQRERAALNLLEGRSLPVPRLAAHGDLAGGSPWVLLTRCEGSPMNDRRLDRAATSSERADWYRWAGRSAAELHRFAVPAFGPWTVDPAFRASEYYSARSSGLMIEATAIRRFDQKMLDDVAAAQHELAGSFDTINQPVLVHRDLNPHNILGTKGSDDRWIRTGLIDFESSGGGDPLEDLRWLAIAEPRALIEDAFLDGYGSTPGSLPRAVERVRYHQLDLILDLATWPQVDDESLIPRAEAAAARLLSA